MPDYPIVKIPQRFLRINKAVPSTPSMPVLPSEPVAPATLEAPNLEIFKENFASSGCLSSLIIWGIGIAMVIVFGEVGGSSSKVEGIAWVGMALMLFGVFRPRHTAKKKAEKRNSEKVKLHNASLEKYKKEKQVYDDEKEIYKKNIKRYNSDKFIYEDFINKSKSDYYEWDIYKFRKKLLNKALSEATQPVVYTKKQYKSGVTEDWFFDKLVGFFSEHNYYAPLPIKTAGGPVVPKGEFGVKILRQYVLPNSGTERPFMPDFILSIASTKQNVVIEIDEPYVGSDGTPIHCIDSKDDYRDKYFLNNGWIVIRFAEEQIIKHSFECCWFIADTLLRNTSSSEVVSIHNEMISYWDEIVLTKIPQWTTEQANKMAFARYRNAYLPNQLSARIREEEYIPLTSKEVEIRTDFNGEEYDKRQEEQRLVDEEEGNNHLPF
ncbi:hypothetical protein QMK33_20020 [Hymenobacter sp. H14-R3]|uniref:hypothetical protein n=1 Tax=Hymenobacter sp. H14-R3 TaxID=3046308 RepID=UPI0024BB7D06|nr:hypothetical protein [Hymenobacter sp. H14-R3]MDJ0367442.1 hypothetical protein [Hymenobacter sp. H14-R3]